MKKMRRILVALLTALTLGVGGVALTSCGVFGGGVDPEKESLSASSASSVEEECPHNFGKWTESAGSDGTSCVQRLYSRTCKDCKEVEWKNGEHDWATETIEPTCTEQGYDEKNCKKCGATEKENYTSTRTHAWEVMTDDTFHWVKCADCKTEGVKGEHNEGADGLCNACKTVVLTKEGILYDISADGTYAEVIGYEGSAINVRIADTYEGVPVRNIYDNAFKSKEIVSVIIPNSVTGIGKDAFYECESLVSVVMGECVTSIGDYAFAGCYNLANVTIPNSVESIGKESFYRCMSLENVMIPEGVVSIADRAFSWCVELTSIEVSNNNANYCDVDGDLYSKDKTTLVQYAIGKTATEFIIPDSVTSIGNSAFKGAYNLTSIMIDENVTNIGDEAFAVCKSLKNVVIPDSVTNIGVLVFSYCTSLERVEIGDSVKSIGLGTFSDCERLVSVVIGDSVTSINSSAFYNCGNLNFNKYDGCKYLGSKDNPYFTLIATENENYSTCQIHAETKIIADGAFSGCKRLANIIIPDSVTDIGCESFYGCSGLTNVVIGSGVTNIEARAFYNCTSLKSVVIGDSVTSIGGGAFSYCTSMVSVVVSKSVTIIGHKAFEGCSSLTGVYYKGTEEEWKKIEVGAGNNKLTSATRYYYSETEVP